MPGDHLVGDGAGYRGEIELAHLGRDLRVIDDLKQQIAQFLAQCRHVGTGDRVGNLIGFFDRVGRDRLERLLDVPGATVLRIPKPPHDIQEAGHLIRGGAFLIRHF